MVDVILSWPLRSTLVLLSVGVLIDAFETILARGDYTIAGPLGPSLSLYGQPAVRGRIMRARPALFTRATVITWSCIQAVTAICSALVTVITDGHHARYALGALTLGMLASCLFTCFRTPLGQNGADQMQLIVLIGLLCYFLGPDSLSRSAGVAFIGVQYVIAMATNGLTKLSSGTWRSGEAMVLIFRTRTYGNALAHGLMSRHPYVARGACWSVIAFETAVPLTVVVPHPGIAVLACLGFHVGIALVMGLNSFVWSFGAAAFALVPLGGFVHSA